MRTPLNRRQAISALTGLGLSACHTRRNDSDPVIEFTRIPQSDSGGKEKNDIIEGTVKGAKPGQQIVLYARSGQWWIQPLRSNSFTKIKGGKWTNATHLGTQYAALLVDAGFHPPFNYGSIPRPGGPIAAVTVVDGSPKPPSPTIMFSGYEWRVRTAPSDRGGHNLYSASNASTDGSGALHLRLNREGKSWNCVEVSLTRSFGYGTYRFLVRDLSHLSPHVVFGMFTWDYAGGVQGNREMDMEIGRWGDPANKNAQFVVQPYYVAANAYRFQVPEGMLTYTLRWERGRAEFRTVRGVGDESRSAVVAEHVFTGGVPEPGIESVRMNHYVFHSDAPVNVESSEVVVERFEYLP